MSCNPVYIGNYFYEYKDLSKREVALQIIEMSHVKDVPYNSIHMAYKESCKLVEKDIYAMRLVSDAINLPASEVPEEISILILLVQK